MRAGCDRGAHPARLILWLGAGRPPHGRPGEADGTAGTEPGRYARFIVIRNSRLFSIFCSRLRSSSTASTGFMSLSTRRSM